MVNVLNKITTKKDNITTTYKIGDLIEGYYDSSTGKFYEESTYTTEIEGASGFIYVDLAGNNIYIYRTDTSSFVKVSGIEEDNFRFGYLNKTNGKFYEDSTYQVEIPPNSNNIYIGLDDNTIYRYDSVNTEYVNVLGSAASKNYTDVVRPGNYDLVESNAVYSAINNAVSSIYTPRGELACAQLTSSLLIPANVGSVYEMSDSGTTSALFLQGAGTTINVGDNVGIIKAGENIYLFNLMGNAFDLTDYQKKELDTAIGSATTVEGALGALNTNKATQAEVNDIVNVLGAKNLLPNHATSQTINGVTFTVNTDGSITVNGTASATLALEINQEIPLDSSKSYILNGCADGGKWEGYRLDAYEHSNGLGFIGIQTTEELIISNKSSAVVRIRIASGTVISNKTFKPMLRLASDPDSTYVPYVPTNKQLVSWEANGILGAKNIFKNNLILTTRNGVTYTPNSDGTFIANGTATANGGLELNVNIDTSLIEGVRYKVSLDGIGADKEGTTSGIMMYIAKYLNGVNVGDVARSNKTNGFTDEFVYHKDSSFDNLRVGCYTFKNASFTNSTLKPMIRLASDTDNTYQPYAMTNRELTDNAGSPKKTLIRTLANGKITATIPKNLGSSYAQGSLKLIGSNADSEAHVTFCLNSDNTAVSVSKLTNLGSKALTLDSASISGNNLVLEITGVQSYAWVSAEYFMSLSAGAHAIQPTWTFTGS